MIRALFLIGLLCFPTLAHAAEVETPPLVWGSPEMRDAPTGTTTTPAQTTSPSIDKSVLPQRLQHLTAPTAAPVAPAATAPATRVQAQRMGVGTPAAVPAQAAPAPVLTAAPATTPQAAPTPAPDADPKLSRFAPPSCDFEMSFPEAPYKSRRCPPGGRTCYDLTSYTMVYDLQTTVDVSVSCNPLKAEDYGRYNEQVMKAALEGMVSQRAIDNYNVEFRQLGAARNAALTGTGMTGKQPKIYSGQIWVGQHSVMTVQAELIGDEHPVADKSFSQILQSIKMKPADEINAAEAEKAQEGDGENKSEKKKSGPLITPRVKAPSPEAPAESRSNLKTQSSRP